MRAAEVFGAFGIPVNRGRLETAEERLKDRLKIG